MNSKDEILARRKIISEIAEPEDSVGKVLYELTARGILNPTSGKAYTTATIRKDLIELRNPRVISEIIGRYTYVKPIWGARVLLNVDKIQPDYIFWDNLRRGKAKGYEFGSLFCQPIIQAVVSYVFGTGISASLAQTGGDDVEYTNQRLHALMVRMQGFFQGVFTDCFALGDQYVIVNPDTSFSIPSPETVTVEYTTGDYRIPVRYVIRTKLERAIVTDIYTETKRIIDIHYFDRKTPSEHHEYDNLIGRIPIIHLTNDKSTNEIYGRPIYEPLLRLFSRYDDLIIKLMEGTELVGNPIPTFSGLDNIQETIAANSSTETYVGIDGTTQTRTVVNFDRLPALWIGKGGSFKFSAPERDFTTDGLAMLRQLFVLMLNFSRIPEFVWGGAVSSSKASVEAQLPPFIQYIQSKRLQLEGDGSDEILMQNARGGLLEILDVWLKMYRLINPNIIVGSVFIEWPEVSLADESLKLKWVQWAKGMNLITDETALNISDLVANPAAELQKLGLIENSDKWQRKFNRATNKKVLEDAQKSMELKPEAVDDLLSNTMRAPEAMQNIEKVGDNDFNYAAAALWMGI